MEKLVPVSGSTDGKIVDIRGFSKNQFLFINIEVFEARFLDFLT